MNVQVLYKVGVFGPGSSLWIIPHLDHSPWSQRINWHLNFQISKMKSDLQKQARERIAKNKPIVYK